MGAIASAQPFKTAKAVLLQATNYLTVGSDVGGQTVLSFAHPMPIQTVGH